MRIAYVAPYQGPLLRKARPTLANLALAGNLKIELIAELLRRSGHEVEILSQGEVVERSAKYYPPLREDARSDPAIPVWYASSLPVRFVNGWWSSQRLRALFGQRHRAAAFDLVILYNMKLPQLACGLFASRTLDLPVVVEHEDDALVDLGGRAGHGVRERLTRRKVHRMLGEASGGIGASPFLLGRLPGALPSLLLRGVVSDEIATHEDVPLAEKDNWVTFSGTLFRSKGLEPLVEAWRGARLAGWELHIAGDGELAGRLKQLVAGDRTIVLHGLLGRTENADLLRRSKICVNPHDLSRTPGNVFAFKIVEYLAAGSHVLTTPMGVLEPELERGITYIADNTPDMIAAGLHRIIAERRFEQTATHEARARYGPAAVARALDHLAREVLDAHRTSRTPPLASHTA